MPQPLNHLDHWLSERNAEHDAVAARAAQENLSRIKWAALAVLPLSLVGVAIFWFGDAAGSAEESAWHRAVGWVYVAMAGTMPLLAWAAQAVARHRQAAGPAGAVTLWAFVCILGFTTAFVTIDQAITPNITAFVVGSIFAGVILLLRPLAAVLLYALAYAAFFVAIALTQHDEILLLSNRANALGAVVLSLIVALLMWRNHTVNELLRQQLEKSSNVLQEKQQQLEYLVAHDALTGLCNRREFTRQAETEVVRALRYETPTCVILLDLDNFKAINDAHGHPVGDRALKHIAALLGGAVRGADLVARLGGEEFIILLPHTRLPAALGLAEKLRRLLEETPLQVDSVGLRLTASFGVAELVLVEGGSFARLYSDADKALYAAKHGGRNRVEPSVGVPGAAG